MSPERRPKRFDLDEVIRRAREVALEHGQHQPTLIVESNRGFVVAQLEELPETDRELRRLMYGAGFGFAQSSLVGKLEQVFLISEAWWSEAAADGTTQVPPSEDPRRKEVLVISNLNVRETRARLVILETVRDGEGELTDLKNFQVLGEEDKLQVESPLLVAFVEGFRTGTRTGRN